MTEDDTRHLRDAIAVAWSARRGGNHPFGAVLVDAAGQVLLRAENSVLTGRDLTGHAETNLVRLASARLSPEELAACTMYASTEPCAMCAGAIHWARVGRLVFGLSAAELRELVGPRPDDLRLPCREVFARSGRPMEVVGPALEAEARAVHAGFWR
ncbi:MAG TPA: nucleoside deaminase [Chloroflexaceae bacterium]|nr:nucleoside deaminase [Chloroflexaceae bacterium]